MYDITGVYCATDVADAVRALSELEAPTVVAGGTDVLVAVRAGALAGASLVSIHGLRDELAGVRALDCGDVEIGALTTFRELEESRVVREHLRVLADAAGTVGGPQIRAMGTVGGNVANGMTSADTASTLLALGARARLRSVAGEREVPLDAFYTAPGQTARRPDELLVSLVVPREGYEGFAGHYEKYAMRRAMDVDVVGVSCLVALDEARERVRDVRLALGVFGPGPIRALEAEDAARGLSVSGAARAIGPVAARCGSPRTDRRATKEFRQRIACELSGRALLAAAARGGWRGDGAVQVGGTSGVAVPRPGVVPERGGEAR